MAGYIPDDKIAEILHAADIVDIIGQTVQLKKAGKDFVGLCPFHTEKTPSFSVSAEKQAFYCFGCGMGGNVFTFLMEHDRMSFPEAARTLAARCGVDIPDRPLSAAQQRERSEKEKLFDLNRRAMDYFCQALHRSAGGKKTMAYLNKRGMTRAVIEAFHLGFAPDGWNNLLGRLVNDKASLPLAEKAGLIVPKNNGEGYYDRFRNRVIFPIMDVNDRVVGFGGRVLDDALPKYLNSPETAIYKKSRSLYGLNLAAKKCRAEGSVFIVEGYFDLLALFTRGVENAAATLGTALTTDHIRLLRRYAGRAVLVFDSDEAGRKAAVRSVNLFLAEDMEARVLSLPAGEDPDSYMMKYGADAFAKAAARAPAGVSFLMDLAVQKHGLSTEGKIKAAADMMAPLAAVRDRVARALYARELAGRLQVDESVILDELARFSEKKAAPSRKGFHAGRPVSGAPFGGAAPPAGRGAAPGDARRIEKKILAMILQYPDMLDEIIERKILDHFEDDCYRSIGETVVANRRDIFDRGREAIQFIADEDKRRIARSLTREENQWNPEGCVKLLIQFENRRRRREDELLRRIKAAEEKNDVELLMELLKTRQLQAVRRKTQPLCLQEASVHGKEGR